MFFRRSSSPAQPPSVRRALLRFDGATVPVTVRFSARARRMSVKVDPARAGVVAVVPVQRDGARAMAAALSFVESERTWIVRQLSRLPARQPIAPGGRIPLRGVEYEIVHSGEAHLTVAVDAERAVIRVGGRPEHAARRLVDFLKRQMRADLEALVADYAARLNVRARRITLRDPASRWGSCSSSRGLSFSWRLIFAPSFVAAYVAAHEVAHLRQMNHGPKFWALVRELIGDVRPAQDWMRLHGAELHRYEEPTSTGESACD